MSFIKVLITCSFTTVQTTVGAAKFKCRCNYKWLAMSKSYFWFTTHAVHVVIHVAVLVLLLGWEGHAKRKELLLKKK